MIASFNVLVKDQVMVYTGDGLWIFFFCIEMKSKKVHKDDEYN